MARVLARPDTRVLAFRRDACLTAGGRPVTLGPRPDAVFLGMDGDAGVFAVDLSDDGRDRGAAGGRGGRRHDMRSLFRTSTRRTPRRSPTPAACSTGRATSASAAPAAAPPRSATPGHQRYCRACDRLLFPRIEPAVIMLVEAPGSPRRCLLARHRGAGPNAYSTLAGFVEIGESLEDAVRRELDEEAGVRVTSVRTRRPRRGRSRPG